MTQSKSQRQIISEIKQSYEDLPYEGAAYPLASIERLATVAELVGLHPVDLQGARVLEIGCAAGENILPMALRHPKTEFIAVDLSENQIAKAQAGQKKLGLKNIKLEALSVEKVDKKWGKFDYIICHDVLSSVPSVVRDAIWRVFSENLSPQGLVYVSYQVFPGAKINEMFRDMQGYFNDRVKHVQTDSPAQKSRRFLEFYGDKLRTSPELSKLLQVQSHRYLAASDSHIAHGLLEAENHPVYFHEFASEAKSVGLQYIAESELGSIFLSNWPTETQDGLVNLCDNDQIVLEQYYDFLTARSSRASILTAQLNTQNLSYFKLRDHLAQLHFSSVVRTPRREDKRSHFAHFWEAKKDQLNLAGVTSNPDLIIQMASQLLADYYGQTIPYNNIVTSLVNRIEGINPATVKATLDLSLQTAIEQNQLAYSLQAKSLPRFDMDAPMIDPQTRALLLAGVNATNAWHETVLLDPVAWEIAALMDGKHSYQEIHAVLVDKVHQQQIVPTNPTGMNLLNTSHTPDTIASSYWQSVVAAMQAQKILALPEPI